MNQEKQTKPKVSRWEKLKIRAELSEIETKERKDT